MSYFKRFAEWQNYVHYIILTIGVAIWQFLTLSLLWNFLWEKLPFDFTINILIISFLVLFNLFFSVFVVDSLVHALFWYIPKPFRWRD